MVDFLSKLMVVDPENRLTSLEALRHPWLNSTPYLDNGTLRRLQMKVMTEEELAEGDIETSKISALDEKPKRSVSKSPLLLPATQI